MCYSFVRKQLLNCTNIAVSKWYKFGIILNFLYQFYLFEHSILVHNLLVFYLYYIGNDEIYRIYVDY